jgi:uncharacterized membrane protein YtjA (UPF0391 family)
VAAGAGEALESAISKPPDHHANSKKTQKRESHHVELDLDIFGNRSHYGEEGNIMLSWAMTFLTLALITAVLGFTGLAGTASHIAWILFVVFLFGSAVSLITGRRGSGV